MKFSSIFKALLQRLAVERQYRHDLKALSGLNDHMLKDIGLRRTENEIVSAFPTFDEKARMKDRVLGDIERAKAHRKTADITRAVEALPGVESLTNKTVICRYCGEQLA
ncbi:DUF1127 domain-containing protein [Salinicola acroporae]|uniref:YjiS-like domain-containing protein n=1 Tax=Salinicola acroporae TaxID=1541440 RepID=A0ABT6I4Y0_9GAMM|nr:DUF1127 domain-containing protein [Salinicola acroporae]MDH4572738.1 hypothetical protein [Salinicola acroporae]